jgi:hypothetical protein
MYDILYIVGIPARFPAEPMRNIKIARASSSQSSHRETKDEVPL